MLLSLNYNHKTNDGKIRKNMKTKGDRDTGTCSVVPRPREILSTILHEIRPIIHINQNFHNG